MISISINDQHQWSASTISISITDQHQHRGARWSISERGRSLGGAAKADRATGFDDRNVRDKALISLWLESESGREAASSSNAFLTGMPNGRCGSRMAMIRTMTTTIPITSTTNTVLVTTYFWSMVVHVYDDVSIKWWLVMNVGNSPDYTVIRQSRHILEYGCAMLWWRINWMMIRSA